MRQRLESDGEEELYAGDTYATEHVLDTSAQLDGGSLMADSVPGSPGPQPQQPQQVDTSKILGPVENYLLPQIDFYSPRMSSKKARHRETFGSSVLHDFEVSGLCPLTRLDDILYQVALADHIRTMQTMYRDTHDEHRLVADLRADHPHTTLPTRALVTKITEGRVRVQALCRLCFGDDSVEMLRATVDLASAYALQGMWQQVSEHMAVASQKLVSVTAPQRRQEQVLVAITAREAAAKVEATYRCLRTHAIRNSGQITRVFLRELVAELSAIVKIVTEHGGEGGGDGGVHSQPMQLAALLHGFFIKFRAENTEALTAAADRKLTPSWGDVVDYLRNECVLMRQWVREMDRGILPQNKAVLMLPFRQADKQQRGVGHPQQLAYYLARMPSTARALAGSTIVKRLQQLKIEVPLLINPLTGDIKFTPQAPVLVHPTRATDRPHDAPPAQKVLYELPVTLEELLAMHVADFEADPVDLLRAQVLTLLGVCHIFSNKLALAEENMREALGQLAALGLETEVTACELYNSIAQMMIMRHRNWQAQKKLRAKKAALAYLEEDENGRHELSERVAALRAQTRARGAIVPTADIISRARSAMVQQLAKTILSNEDDPTVKAIEAAFRYLVKSYEILVSAHGSIHPSVGTACLAVASVQSIVGDYTVAREWLVRGLRALERLDPVPHRAVAFVQTQLSQVLHKQGHADEALRVLDKAARFHLQQARERLRASQVTESGVLTTPHVARGTPLYEDAMQAIELLTRIVQLSGQGGGKWAAAEQAEIAADLAEAVFGWDSAVACDRRKVAADCFACILDWPRAFASYKRAYDACEVLYSKGDARTLGCARLIAHAHNEMQGGTDDRTRREGGGRRLDLVPGEDSDNNEEDPAEDKADDWPYSPRGRRGMAGVTRVAAAGAHSPASSDLTLSPQPTGNGKDRRG